MRKVKWGVLGTADIARRCTIPGMLQAENAHLYAIAGRSLEKAEAFRREFGFEKAYGSYDALLADPLVEAVYIPLSNELHYEWAAKALQAKKHVLCEKPLAPNAAQVEELARIAAENGVFVMEAFAYLHSPYIAAVKGELEKGTIGDVVYMESEFVTSDYDLSNIRMRRETCGGAMYDLGCYCVSQILWLLGEEPSRVQAIGEFSDHNVDNCTTAVMSFPSGKKATLVCGMCLHREPFTRIDRFRIHGTKGCIISDEEFNGCGELTYVVQTNGKRETKTVHTPDNYSLEIAQLGRCVLNGEQPWVSPEFSAINSRTMDRILEAINY